MAGTFGAVLTTGNACVSGVTSDGIVGGNGGAGKGSAAGKSSRFTF